MELGVSAVGVNKVTKTVFTERTTEKSRRDLHNSSNWSRPLCLLFFLTQSELSWKAPTRNEP